MKFNKNLCCAGIKHKGQWVCLGKSMEKIKLCFAKPFWHNIQICRLLGLHSLNIHKMKIKKVKKIDNSKKGSVCRNIYRCMKKCNDAKLKNILFLSFLLHKNNFNMNIFTLYFCSLIRQNSIRVQGNNWIAPDACSVY